MKNLRWLFSIFLFLALLYLSLYGAGTTVRKEFSVNDRSDGGYSLHIVLYKRHWKLITAEGIFPIARQAYFIELTGKGKDWSYRNQMGNYYSLNEIASNQSHWDFGYAWLSADRKYLYLNLFWVNSPDNFAPADVNGRYEIQKGS